MPGEKTDSRDLNHELIYNCAGGEEIYRCGNSIFVRLPPGRNCISTSCLNGGYREDLEAVFNHQPAPPAADECCDLEGRSVVEYLGLTAQRLGLDPEKTTGMLTAASMDNAAISEKQFRGLGVTAIVTAGIEVNGGRAGDPASYFEEDGSFASVGGTIITILLVDGDLSENTLLRAMMTAVEAKTVAIQQLMAPSRYSEGIVTGSGTDQITIISRTDSGRRLTEAGKHSKLGELIGRSIIEATTEALFRQTGLGPDSQMDMMKRLGRFGIDESSYAGKAIGNVSKNPGIVAMTAALLHIEDEIRWGLIPEDFGKEAAFAMMTGICRILGDDPLYDHKIPDREKSIIESWIMITSEFMGEDPE